MMNRFLAITVLLLISFFSQNVTYDSKAVSNDYHHYVLDDSNSNNVIPFDDNDHDKHKFLLIHAFTILVTFLLITRTNKYVSFNHKKFIFLTPIFYQSNYVDTALLKKS
ncbi:hypothetical protein [Pseudoneobacillus sp. C159]